MATAVDGDGIIAVVTVIVVSLVVFITCRFGCKKGSTANNAIDTPAAFANNVVDVQVGCAVNEHDHGAFSSPSHGQALNTHSTRALDSSAVAIQVGPPPSATVEDWPHAPGHSPTGPTPATRIGHAQASPAGMYPRLSPSPATNAAIPSSSTTLPPLSPYMPSAGTRGVLPLTPACATATTPHTPGLTSQARDPNTPATRTPSQTPASGQRGKAHKYDYCSIQPTHGVSRPQRVYVRVSGVDRGLVESTLTDLVRDKGIYKRKGEVHRRHGEGSYYLRSHAHAAARANALDGRGGTPRTLSPAPLGTPTHTPSYPHASAVLSPQASVTSPGQAAITPGKPEQIDVEHTWECRMLGHAIVQTPEYHTGLDGGRGLLAQVNLEGSARSHQPIVVQNAISPLYMVHNCCNDPTLFNLKLMENSLNVVKTHVIDAWLRHRYMLAEGRGQGASQHAEQLDLVGAYRTAYREHSTRRRASLPPLSPEDVEELACALGAELKGVEEPYCARLDDRAAALRHTGTHIHAHITDSNRLQALCESIKMMEEELGVHR